MASRFRFFALIALLFVVRDIGSAESMPSTEPSARLEPRQLRVRVLLEEKPSTASGYWEITTEHSMVITNLENRESNTNKWLCKAARISTGRDGLHTIDPRHQSIPVTKALRIQARDGYICVDGTWYQGSLYVMQEGSSTLLINNLDIEDYIYSVLKSENFPGWPVEMHKVLAIASRSYVIAKVLEAQKQGRLYHIKNTNAHQTYNGYHECDEIKRAVDETRNLFLAHNNQPIVAMYDICCGGVIPAHKAGVNFSAYPYLARTYPCHHCKSSKSYNWSVSYPLEYCERTLKKEIPHLKTFKDLDIKKKDKAGIVHAVTIKAASGYHPLPGKRVSSLFKKMRSSCFTVQKKQQTLVFKGHGHGHHMGLCQWGARQLVREGWNYRRILQYYYPGTHFMRLEYRT